MTLRAVLAGILVGLVLVAPSQAVQAQDESGIAVGAKAPVVTVNDLDGKPVDLGQWIGKKPVLIEFWATWCTNCEALLPRFKEAHGKYGAQVEFLGVNVTVINLSLNSIHYSDYYTILNSHFNEYRLVRYILA